ncbi:MAG: hypothetical protein HC922_03930 [Leptolyngbyaceae cyanobacterium SM2_3_12]|nr:hypothetical protein [Leptolyngbyaceae cyanobacterium SM2_3_12]
MSALNEQWQAARQQRQSQVVERRDQVNASLGRWQADRLAHTVRLRQDLGQVVADLQAETSLWLTQISPAATQSDSAPAPGSSAVYAATSG